MEEIFIAYWSGTGNTKAMADYIAQGIEEGGKKARLLNVEEMTDASILQNEKVFALGCPSMGVEVLEEAFMEPFVCDVEAFAAGKEIALFGSYGWGDGEWMRNWTERMEDAGAAVIGGEGVMCQEAPDADAIQACIELGRLMAGR